MSAKARALLAQDVATDPAATSDERRRARRAARAAWRRHYGTHVGRASDEPTAALIATYERLRYRYATQQQRATCGPSPQARQRAALELGKLRRALKLVRARLLCRGFEHVPTWGAASARRTRRDSDA